MKWNRDNMTLICSYEISAIDFNSLMYRPFAVKTKATNNFEKIVGLIILFYQKDNKKRNRFEASLIGFKESECVSWDIFDESWYLWMREWLDRLGSRLMSIFLI